MRRLDIGVLSYKRLEPLQRTIASMLETARCDLRIYVFDNPSDDGLAWPALRDYLDGLGDPFIVTLCQKNRGYAGGVNLLLQNSETEYIAYCDNDVNFLTPGWDEQLCGLLDRHHELGMVFPNGGAFEIDRGPYREVMWSPGFCWVLTRAAMKRVGLFDETLGHQEECDYAMRLRMAGLRLGALREVQVAHEATHTNDPASIDRINRGVVNFVNKWCRHFTGELVNYHSPNVLRWEDWPPNALYLEEYWKLQYPGLNTGFLQEWGNYDLLQVPRLKNFYRGRII